MEIGYKKNNNGRLFLHLEEKYLLNVENPQNYIPLYENFFSLNETNYNNINLNQKYNITSINEKLTENKYVADISNNGSIDKKKIFCKLSPLYDPIKFMIGKYDDTSSFLSLPDLTNSDKSKKINDVNNAAYVDSFFTYLTSQILHTYNFIHGVDFYGSFLAIKNDFKVNVSDDIDYLYDSTYFKDNNNVEFNNITFSIENEYVNDVLFSDSRTNKDKLNVSEDKVILNLSDINDLEKFDSIFKVNHTNRDDKEITEDKLDVLFENKVNTSNLSKVSRASSETCSSRSSNTSCETHNDDSSGSCTEDDSESCSESGSDNSYSNDSCSTASEDQVIINISKFPIQVICLEDCYKTLDSLLVSRPMSDREWDSLIMQILMMLVTYQKAFDLTHNDLHTNNIMYNTTNKKFLEYRYNGQYYNIPTFGRIYKIIDFGRAIYKYKGKQMCSDSFHQQGDAATQYNCAPYYNDKKKEILPNLSFDLCRLGCSLFDFIFDDLEDKEEIKDIKDIKNIDSTIKKIIVNWCNDDKGRNVIYKKNGDERYPEFKLYKMIARTVHKHNPQDVLNHSYFDKYKTDKLKRQKCLIDIDNIPVMT